MPLEVTHSGCVDSPKLRWQTKEEVTREEIDVNVSKATVTFESLILEEGTFPRKMYEVPNGMATVVAGPIVQRID